MTSRGVGLGVKTFYEKAHYFNFSVLFLSPFQCDKLKLYYLDEFTGQTERLMLNDDHFQH